MTKRSSIAKDLEENERLSQYITGVIKKEYSRLVFDNETRKAALKTNKAFFNKVTKTVLGR
jgi:hypothetical protein